MEMHQGAGWDMESLEVLPWGLLPRHKQGQRQPHPGKQVVVCTEGYGGGLHPTTHQAGRYTSERAPAQGPGLGAHKTQN